MDFTNECIVHKSKNDLEYLQFKHFNTEDIKHCITTRKGGVSFGDFGSLNLKFDIGDEEANVIKNNKIICEKLDIEYENIVSCKQVHGDIVKRVDGSKTDDLSNVDGMITNSRNIVLITHYADCVPLLFFDPIQKVIGNSHAGWKGTVKKIGQKTIYKMKQEFGSRVEDILVGIGPSIGQCCFETDKEVYEQFVNNFSHAGQLCIKKGDKYYIDLWKANNLQLQDIGVRLENICISEICTMCNKDSFFSYRAEAGKTGRFASIIQLV